MNLVKKKSARDLPDLDPMVRARLTEMAEAGVLTVVAVVAVTRTDVSTEETPEVLMVDAMLRAMTGVEKLDGTTTEAKDAKTGLLSRGLASLNNNRLRNRRDSTVKTLTCSLLSEQRL